MTRSTLPDPPTRLELSLGARAVLQQLLEQRVWIWWILGLVVCGIVALLERQHGRLGAADRALSGAALGMVLPLLAYAICDSGLRQQRLQAFLRPLARHGGNPHLAALGALLALLCAAALAGAVLSASTTFMARGLSDRELPFDLAASAWVGILAGATYAAWLAFASTFGKKGGGRRWFLLFDFAFGVTTASISLPWPRGHVRNWAGGAPPLDFSQNLSAAMLVSMLVGTLVLAVRRARA